MEDSCLNYWLHKSGKRNNRQTDEMYGEQSPTTKKRKKSLSPSDFKQLLEEAGMMAKDDSDTSVLGLAIDYVKKLQQKGRQTEM